MLKVKLLSFLVIFSSCLFVVKAQKFKQKYFERIINSLTSDYYAGRGYVDNGMSKSALYLQKEFKKNKLQSFSTDYEQKFTYPINVIQNAELKINGLELKYGIDYIVKPNAQSVSDVGLDYSFFDTTAYTESFQSKNKTRDFIVNDHQLNFEKNIILPPLENTVDSIKQYYKQWSSIYEREQNINRGIFRFTKEKLTSSLSQRQANTSEFIISDKFYSDQLKINSFMIKSEFIENFEAKNLIGYVDGKNNDSIVVITAHYDHLGKVGETVFPGASDNASGVAMMLAFAKYYSKHRPQYKTVFIAFAGEEAGLLGADYFVKNPLFELSKIKFLVNLDIMGAGEKGIQVVNGKVFKKEFDKLTAINANKNYLAEVKIRGESCNSDHCPFYLKGVPSFFIYTLGGKGFYHEPDDTRNNLNLDYSSKVFSLLRDFINTISSNDIR
ncbi:Peptidase family M28 [Chishuiella changwenlii]|uniref:Peptidase family M28 n=1 Tax=Chishuiella changwenlii TaxID=1434701 RepID=A0A1M7BLW0_9FLAO|nr:M28 family metallopeptidase [Chishuiella changwenlii]GGF02787.1 hypothetical protein GCM10010984_20350 [Chishuiella changwenlii]SHL55903.1 Peptidase family M28 [Chishuiella changwenlii]